MAFVVDNCVAMAWCFEDEASPYTESLLERLRVEQAVVPAIWPLEVANALLMGEGRRRLTEAQTARFMGLLTALPIMVDTEALSKALGPIMAIGRQHTLSAYDASYLELAMRQGLPLATQDAQLRDAAAMTGIPLVQ